MATDLIKNGAIAGALAGILAERGASATDPAAVEPALDANVAAAFGAQFLTANAALTVPMADANNANIFLLTFAASFGVLSGRCPRSTTATDYATQASAAAAAAKATVAKLV
jgi:hypothetical protein